MLLSAESPKRGSLCTRAFRGHAAALQWSGASSPAGVGWEHVQTDNRGSPGTWESPTLLLGKSRLEIPGYQLQASGGALVRQGANTTSAPEVSPSEGNEVRRDGGRMS